MAANNRSVIIIGGGWAGLSTAISLCSRGYKTELFESAKQTGGRARCTPFGQSKVDNGQHLMIGAYHTMQKLMSRIGLDVKSIFKRYPVRLQLRDSSHYTTTLRTARLPAPLHLLGGFFKSRGFSFTEQTFIFRFFLRHMRRGFKLETDISVKALLAEQPDSLCHKLWYPLCLATLNTAPEIASAKLFLRVLNDSFMHSPGDSDLLIPVSDLGALFPRPAMEYIENHDGIVHIGKRVNSLEITNNRVTGIIAGEQLYEADHVIIATSHKQAIALIEQHDILGGITARLNSIQTQPICTVYLKYPADVQLDFPMIGLLNTTSQWVFDRRICGQPGMMAVVISADGPHMQLDKETLAQLVIDELAEHFPHWPEPSDRLVIREKRATFSAVVDIDRYRPAHETPVENLWLVGDYTATGYPATLEGAVNSGVQCAQAILSRQDQDKDNV